MSTYLFDHGWEREQQRLDSLAAFFDPGTLRHLEAVGVDKGWRCLEVGGGTGSVARWLADRVGGDGRVVATDLETGFLERLRVPNLEVLQHDIVAEDLPEGGFDLVHCRLVLEHLDGRDVALRRMVDALAPGGWLVVEDFDWITLAGLSGPGARLMPRFIRAVLPLFRGRGYDHRYARRLPVEFHRHGLVDLRAEALSIVLQGGNGDLDWARLSLQRFRALAAQVSEGDLDGLGGVGRLLAVLGRLRVVSDRQIRRLEALIDDPDFFCLAPAMVTARGRRPAGG